MKINVAHILHMLDVLDIFTVEEQKEPYLTFSGYVHAMTTYNKKYKEVG